MSTRFFRSKVVLAAGVAFAGGVMFASSMDFTKYGWAQGNSSKQAVVQPSVRGPNSPDAAGSFANVAERVTPSVVAVRTIREARALPRGRGRQQVPQGMEEFLKQFGGQMPQQGQQEMRGEGSGFIVSQDGYIITNNHVVADADVVDVTLSDRRIFRAKVVGRDSTTDVAVVKIDAKGLPTLPIGNEDNARIGDWVLAVGNPLGLDFTVTAGIISAKARGSSEVQLPGAGQLTVSDFIQTDAAINPGNSGGPLINLKGEAIGLNSAIASETGYYSGYGFAIPISLVKQVADQLIKDGRVRLPMIGVTIQQADADASAMNKLTVQGGAVVQGFGASAQSPAKDAGIMVGDLIVAIAGQPVDRVSALQRIVRSHEVGETIQVDVLRYGEKKSFKVKLIEAEAPPKVATASPVSNEVEVPAPKSVSKIGITVEAIPADVAQRMSLPTDKGVRVVDVAQGSPARDKLAPGSDVITDILFPGPRHAVKSVADLTTAISSLKSGEYLSLLVVQPGAPGSRVVNIRAN